MLNFWGVRDVSILRPFKKINMGKSWQIYCHLLPSVMQIMINLPIFNPYLAWGAIMKIPSNLNACFRDYAKTCQEIHNVWCRQYPQDMAQKQIPYWHHRWVHPWRVFRWESQQKMSHHHGQSQSFDSTTPYSTPPTSHEILMACEWQCHTKSSIPPTNYSNIII